MDQLTTPNGQTPYPNRPGPSTRGVFRIGRMARLCVPVVAVLGAGYGVSNYLGIQYQRRSQVLQEEERLRKNALLMDAYGDKTSLEDVERALDLYHQKK